MTLVSDFDFELPPERIAQTPAARRDESRLLVLDRLGGSLEHAFFRNLLARLNQGDLLVLNDTKVLPARLYGKREGGGRTELLLLEEVEKDVWTALARPAKRLRKGSLILFGEGALKGEVLEDRPDGEKKVFFSGEKSVFELIHSLGEMPLPPYISERSSEEGRYQTVYASPEGSVAAPTAGLHFTEGLLEELKQKGIEVRFLTLHVGIGTFRPVSVERVEDHAMHSERFWLSPETASCIEETRKRGNKVVAVGTTVARTLEHCAETGRVLPQSGQTNIFIKPGFAFKAVDALLTNFHLPKSTLLMLVSAFVEMKKPGEGREIVLAAYEEAVEKNYRFFSFGDAMLII
ncbi:MAG TPA: tRNA preQ1(34) S-adenosylmethionine ribosyltransferase-isomerase QueA [Cyanobacteria bacterium UBA8530]|nr:tRNA preQ1(34) S-adenosylmethionine ribosyltransferase-isomerase QueA [Cyanobacteria bacterium UBA8530]